MFTEKYKWFKKNYEGVWCGVGFLRILDSWPATWNTIQIHLLNPFPTESSIIIVSCKFLKPLFSISIKTWQIRDHPKSSAHHPKQTKDSACLQLRVNINEFKSIIKKTVLKSSGSFFGSHCNMMMIIMKRLPCNYDYFL
jgi:hypothetical protein